MVFVGRLGWGKLIFFKVLIGLVLLNFGKILIRDFENKELNVVKFVSEGDIGFVD